MDEEGLQILMFKNKNKIVNNIDLEKTVDLYLLDIKITGVFL